MRLKNSFCRFAHTIPEVRKWIKTSRKKINQKKNNEKFNSITQKVKPENQNQSHNVRSEAVEPKIRQV